MKIYLHIEILEPDFTLPLTLDVCDTRTVADIKRLFIDTYNARHGKAIAADQYVLVTAKKKQLASSDAAISVCRSNSDLFLAAKKGGADSGVQRSQPTPAVAATKAPNPPSIAPKPPSQTPAAVPPASTAVSPSAKKAEPGAAQAKVGWVRPAIPQIKVESQVKQWTEQSLTVARQLKAKDSLRQACEAWRQILVVSPGETECFEGLAQVALDCGRHHEAMDWWCQALAVGEPTEAVLTNLGKAAHAIQDYSAALMFYNRAMELALAKDRSSPCHGLQVLIGRTLYKNGSQDAAIQLYTNVLQKDEGHTAALLEYAQAYVDRQRPGEALRILLRVLVHSPNDKVAREQISGIVQGQGGLTTLYGELGDAANSGPALAFMATLIKDYGAVEESVAIYYKALEASPNMTTYALNLVHTLEVCNRYQEAMDLCVKFCLDQKDMGVGGRYTNSDVASLMEGVTDIYHTRFRFANDKDAHSGHARTCMWQPNYGAVVRDRTDEAPLPDSSQSTALPSPAAAAPAASEQKLPPYTADELDLLALHFTMVKILYVAGALALIPGIVEVIEPARRGWDMHLTTIRNEHAYYCCVAQLFASIPHPLPDSPKVIYMAGDSHSLSSAWQVINIHGRDTLLAPKLVTGLKCWHLRPESVFFPKNNFHNVTDSIPHRADVVFLFGEIDCREGILRAVEKGRYKDIEEGMDATIGYYLTALGSLQRQKQLNIYVQPVAPVLNETREVVKVFNRMLKDAVLNAGTFRFLDIFASLLTPDQKALHPDFDMDGTHMGPKYVRLIEDAINAFPAPQE